MIIDHNRLKIKQAMPAIIFVEWNITLPLQRLWFGTFLQPQHFWSAFTTEPWDEYLWILSPLVCIYVLFEWIWKLQVHYNAAAFVWVVAWKQHRRCIGSLTSPSLPPPPPPSVFDYLYLFLLYLHLYLYILYFKGATAAPMLYRVVNLPTSSSYLSIWLFLCVMEK